MIPLFTQDEFNNSKSRDKLPCQCHICSNPFYKIKYDIQKYLKSDKSHRIMFCSLNCRKTKKLIKCSNCGCSFEKLPSQMEKSSNHFCSQSCSATYNNKNKTHGNRRSKLEIWLEEQLTILYPNLQIDFNKKEIIGSELDIYFPSLNLAIELNGIFHYEPIYGVNKLSQIQENDKSKTKLCHDLKIDLCIIDVSQQKYVKPSTSQKYLDIIVKIVNSRITK